MENCKLCNKNDADKKGSHIVPHFLLKRIENIEGRTERDYEIGYQIERLNSQAHFGRSVSPEKLEESFGEITDEDIAKNKHPLVVDNFFCSECEKRLSILENEYATTIENVKEDVYESGVSSETGILFWGSILWRMSINKKSGVTLSPEQNELLRKILDDFLPKPNGETNGKLILDSELVRQINYRLLRCNNCKKEDARFLLFHPDFYNSLCLFIDEYVLVYSLNGEYGEIENKDCFGINKLFLQAPINEIGKQEVIKPYSQKIFKEINTRIVNKLKDVYVDGLYEFFDKIHVAAGGKGSEMPMKIKLEIMAEITSDEKKIGRRYTQEEIVNSAYKIMKKYAP